MVTVEKYEDCCGVGDQTLLVLKRPFPYEINLEYRKSMWLVALGCCPVVHGRSSTDNHGGSSSTDRSPGEGKP